MAFGLFVARGPTVPAAAALPRSSRPDPRPQATLRLHPRPGYPEGGAPRPAVWADNDGDELWAQPTCNLASCFLPSSKLGPGNRPAGASSFTAPERRATVTCSASHGPEPLRQGRVGPTAAPPPLHEVWEEPKRRRRRGQGGQGEKGSLASRWTPRAFRARAGAAEAGLSSSKEPSPPRTPGGGRGRYGFFIGSSPPSRSGGPTESPGLSPARSLFRPRASTRTPIFSFASPYRSRGTSPSAAAQGPAALASAASPGARNATNAGSSQRTPFHSPLYRARRTPVPSPSEGRAPGASPAGSANGVATKAGAMPSTPSSERGPSFFGSLFRRMWPGRKGVSHAAGAGGSTATEAPLAVPRMAPSVQGTTLRRTRELRLGANVEGPASDLASPRRPAMTRPSASVEPESRVAEPGAAPQLPRRSATPLSPKGRLRTEKTGELAVSTGDMSGVMVTSAGSVVSMHRPGSAAARAAAAAHASAPFARAFGARMMARVITEATVPTAVPDEQVLPQAAEAAASAATAVPEQPETGMHAPASAEGAASAFPEKLQHALEGAALRAQEMETALQSQLQSVAKGARLSALEAAMLLAASIRSLQDGATALGDLFLEELTGSRSSSGLAEDPISISTRLPSASPSRSWATLQGLGAGGSSPDWHRGGPGFFGSARSPGRASPGRHSLAAPLGASVRESRRLKTGSLGQDSAFSASVPRGSWHEAFGGLPSAPHSPRKQEEVPSARQRGASSGMRSLSLSVAPSALALATASASGGLPSLQDASSASRARSATWAASGAFWGTSAALPQAPAGKSKAHFKAAAARPALLQTSSAQTVRLPATPPVSPMRSTASQARSLSSREQVAPGRRARASPSPALGGRTASSILGTAILQLPRGMGPTYRPLEATGIGRKVLLAATARAQAMATVVAAGPTRGAAAPRAAPAWGPREPSNLQQELQQRQQDRQQQGRGLLPGTAFWGRVLQAFMAKMRGSWEEWVIGLGIVAVAVGWVITMASGGALGPPIGQPGRAAEMYCSSACAPNAVGDAGTATSVVVAAAGAIAPGGSAGASSRTTGSLAGQAAVSPAVPYHLKTAKPGVLELTSATLTPALRKRPTFIMFYAPWCPYCQRMDGAWSELAEKFAERGIHVQVARVDGSQYPELARKFSVPGFPTLMLFDGENPVAVHKGRRDAATMFSFVVRHTS